MRLEYFQMIDRFVAVDVGGRVASRRMVGWGGAEQLPAPGVREASERRAAWITGVGRRARLGEGVEKAWDHRDRGARPRADDKAFPPCSGQQRPPTSFDKQV